MLSLQLKSGEYLTIGDDIAVQIFQQSGGAFSVAVKAPREVPILRGSVLERNGEDKPEGLREKPPKRPSIRSRNAKNMEQFAKRREREADAIREMRGVLNRMEAAGHCQNEIAALRTQIDRIAGETQPSCPR